VLSKFTITRCKNYFPFPAVGARYDVTFLVVCRVVSAKVVGATSSESAF